MTTGDDARPQSAGSEGTDRVQLLVEDSGNRRAIERMLEGQFEVLTDRSVADADLYLVEDRLFERYRRRLRERVETDHPTFCPVVVIRRNGSPNRLGAPDDRSEERPLLVDETVDAPIDETQLVRRLRSLLVRRTQSAALTEYVSALEERERDLRRFDRAVEATRNAVAILDTDGRVEYVNPAFESFSGYTGADMIDRPLRTLQTEQADDPFDKSFWRTLGDGSGWEGEIVVERTDGEQRVAATTLAAIERNGDVVGFVAVLRDVTDRIQRERTLRERQDELDLLRQVLTRYLRHNLGNGLNVIRGHAELLAEAASSPEASRSADAIVEQTNRLIETSDTARRYSSLIDRGGEPSEYDLSAVIEETVAEIDSAYPSVSITVDAPETCTVIAGRGIEQAVGGLVENAAKHNDADDPWVRIRVRARAGSRGARLTIEDNGPGIPDHDLAAFEQGTESSLEHSSGVGIWLSKWVIEGAGGTLSFDSTPDGMRVSVEFPPPSMVGSDGLDVSDLKARERRLRTVIDRMTDAVIEVDDAWTVTFLDERAGSILEVDADAAVGSDLFDVFPDADDPAFEDACREAMDGRSSTEAEGYHAPIDAWLSAYFYPDLNGGLSVYFRDTTERNLREQKLRRHATIVEALDDPVYALDDEGRFEYVNDAFVEMVGYDRETIIGEGPELIKSERAHESGIENLRRLLAEDAPTSVTFEIEIEPASGDPIPCEDRMSVLRYDEASFDGSAGVLRDVSDRVEREDRLRGLNETNRELIAADSAEEIADIAVRAAENVLGLEASAVHLRDGDRRQLVPVATTDALRELIGQPPALGEDGSIAWRAYEASEPLIVEDVRADRDVHDPDTPIRSELYLPLGEHGVLIAGSETPASFDERDRLFGELLAENAATALAQLDRIDPPRRREPSQEGGQTASADPADSTDPADPTER